MSDKDGIEKDVSPLAPAAARAFAADETWQPTGAVDAPLDDDRRRQRVWLVRALALLVVAAFFLLTTNGLWRLLSMPSWSLLKQSRALARDPAVTAWMEAVVRVTAGRGGGTGFNTHPAGQVVTNQHLTADAKQIQVSFRHDGAQFTLHQWQEEPQADLAILSLPGASDLPFLELEREHPPQPGDALLIIGNPHGFFRIISHATVLGWTRLPALRDPVLVLDGPVYQGNSGSPVLNAEGKVVGVIFATTRRATDDQTVALAIAAQTVATQLDRVADAQSLP